MNDHHKPVAITTTTVRAEFRAADTKHGMTLDELARFVDTAKRLEVPGDTVVRIDTTWRSSIKTIRAGAVK